MYGAMIGDLVGFPYEYKHEDLTDRSIPLFKGKSFGFDAVKDGAAQAGEDFSDKTVLTAAVEAGILQFERRLPEILAGNKADEAGQKGAVNIKVGGGNTQGPHIPQNAFEENYKTELTAALRRLGQAYPLAGYPMDLSIWIFREGAAQAQAEDAGPAARVSPVAWSFQDDLYMMRHMARLQAGLTHRSRQSITAAEAAACAVFLAIHGSTKDYIAGYLEKEFGYKIPDEKGMQEEILRAGGAGSLSALAGMSGTSDMSAEKAEEKDPGSSLPARCVRAAMCAFLNGRDFEDVLRRAVSIGGNSADITAIACSIAEAFFGIPEEIKAEAMRRLPADIKEAADAFAAREAQKKRAREQNPAAKARWENALTRASSKHPAEVQGNEPLEQAIANMRQKRDEQSFIAALEVLRIRMNAGGRVFVPLQSARRAEPSQIPGAADAAGSGTPQNAMVYSMQVIRSTDGRIWQPAYTSRPQLDRANAAQVKAGEGSRNTGMVLSYSLDALLKRFLPVGEEGAKAAEAQNPEGVPSAANPAVHEIVPDQIQGIVLNPYGNAFFLPRKTIGAVFAINRQAAKQKAAGKKED